jgi:hypothetical protein
MPGIDAVLLWKPNGIGDATAWAEADVIDPEFDYDYDVAESTSRLGGGTKTEESTLLGIRFMGKVQADRDNTFFVALEDAAASKGKLGVHQIDADGGAGEGPKATVQVRKFKRTENNDGLVEYDYELSPCKDNTNPPVWATDDRGS